MLNINVFIKVFGKRSICTLHISICSYHLQLISIIFLALLFWTNFFHNSNQFLILIIRPFVIKTLRFCFYFSGSCISFIVFCCCFYLHWHHCNRGIIPSMCSFLISPQYHVREPQEVWLKQTQTFSKHFSSNIDSLRNDSCCFSRQN
jgi:hypothetical protein